MANAIPAGHHTITPHLIVKGASEAIEFYKRAFGAEELSRMPFPGPDGQMKLGHAELQIGDSRLFLADEFPQQGATGPSGSSPVTIHMYVTDADAVFNRAVEAGATARCRRPTCSGATAMPRWWIRSGTTGRSPPTWKTSRPSRCSNGWPPPLAGRPVPRSKTRFTQRRRVLPRQMTRGDRVLLHVCLAG